MKCRSLNIEIVTENLMLNVLKSAPFGTVPFPSDILTLLRLRILPCVAPFLSEFCLSGYSLGIITPPLPT